jgi:hypothetical protein
MYRQLYSFVTTPYLLVTIFVCTHFLFPILLQENNEIWSTQLPPGFCYTSRLASEFSLAGSIMVNITSSEMFLLDIYKTRKCFVI